MTHQMPLLHSGIQRRRKDFSSDVSSKSIVNVASDAKLFWKIMVAVVFGLSLMKGRAVGSMLRFVIVAARAQGHGTWNGILIHSLLGCHRRQPPSLSQSWTLQYRRVKGQAEREARALFLCFLPAWKIKRGNFF